VVASGLRDRLPRGTPVVFLTTRDGLDRRVQAVTAGAALYLAKPMTGTDLLRELAQYVPQRYHGCSVLLVDDDPSVVAQVNALLTPLGVAVTPANGPEEFWTQLSSDLPTLILLDVSLPIYSGFELCRALKADPRVREVPVVFLTARLGVSDRTAAFQAGADDYIPKPLSRDEFVARVTGRLQATMQARERAFRDRLTGLIGRAAIDDALARTIRRLGRMVQQSGGALTGRAAPGLMLFDADHFKSINDTAGHLTGDYALQQVARALEQSVRASDVVGRWGGEEFIVVVSEGGLDAFRAVFDRVRAALAARPVYGPNGFTRTLTVSAGAVVLSHWDKPVDVVARADEALYRAKQGGRDRWELAATSREG
jgi:diguanylate cyclase (GGDEF)-like protein